MITDTVNALFWKDDKNAQDINKEIGPTAVEGSTTSSSSFLKSMQKNLVIAASGDAAAPNELPGFMDLVREGSDQKESTNKGPHDIDRVDGAQVKEDIRILKNDLDSVHTQVRNQAEQGQLDKVHYQASKELMEAVNPDLHEIANLTGQEHPELKQEEEETFLDRISNWMTSGEKTLTAAMNYIAKTDRFGSPARIDDFLRLQYAVQRATQKTELFASIVGAVVTGIKTLMTTQLG